MSVLNTLKILLMLVLLPCLKICMFCELFTLLVKQILNIHDSCTHTTLESKALFVFEVHLSYTRVLFI